MTDLNPEGAKRRFSPTELDEVTGLAPDDLTSDMRVARELEALAAGTVVFPSAVFVDRVMDAVVAEPSPVPVRLAGSALRHGAIGAFFAAVGDAWRVSTRRGFPMAVRAQAMALVLLVVAVGAGSAAATAGALGVFDANRPSQGPNPSLVVPPASIAPTDTTPTLPAEASPSLDPRASPGDTEEPSASAEDNESEEPSGSTSDDGTKSGSLGSGSGPGSGSGSGDDRSTSGSSDDGSGGGSTSDGYSSDDSDDHSTPRPSVTPEPTDTPQPSATPRTAETPNPTQTPAPTTTSGDSTTGGDATPSDD